MNKLTRREFIMSLPVFLSGVLLARFDKSKTQSETPEPVELFINGSALIINKLPRKKLIITLDDDMICLVTGCYIVGGIKSAKGQELDNLTDDEEATEIVIRKRKRPA